MSVRVFGMMRPDCERTTASDTVDASANAHCIAVIAPVWESRVIEATVG